MTRKIQRTCWAAVASLAFLCLQSGANAQFLGTANSYAVLGGSTVTNTGDTILSGDLGVWPGTSITGFPPGIVTNGSIHAGDDAAKQAQADVLTAYNTLAGESFNQNLTGQDLGGMTLGAGVYHFNSSAALNGTLILDAKGNPNARFDFQMGSTLISGSNASVQIINGGDDCNVYWQVGSSATLGTGTAFAGHILADSSITMNTGTVLEGSALAIGGAVTMDTNKVNACVAPEPPAYAMLGLFGLVPVALKRRRR